MAYLQSSDLLSITLPFLGNFSNTESLAVHHANQYVLKVYPKSWSFALVSLNAWAKSDIGRRRANNEDAFFVGEKEGLFMVADGMGGHRGGDRASLLAIDSAAREYTNKRLSGMPAAQALEHAMNAAATDVYEMGHADEALWGMGTTLSILAIDEQLAHIAHIGDTRIYQVRDACLQQLTRDHSLVYEQVQAGILSQEEARVSPLRNIITRALGQNKVVSADFFSVPTQNNDTFLLCSDGLTTMIYDHTIEQMINKLSPQISIEKLIDEANNNGGEDNITAVLVHLLS